MNWKSYTLVSGAGVLATWFAASQPAAPGRVMPAQPREAAGVQAAASDIEQQADRLQARLQQHALYREPQRNLFRFSEPVAPRQAPVAAAPPPVTVADPEPAPLPPAIRLTAIAVDADVRTAVLSTPAGVVLAREGDDVLGRFRLAKVEEDAVEVVTISDGVTTRLTLR
jgi:hypothetical protein